MPEILCARGQAYKDISGLVGGGTVNVLQAMSGYERHPVVLKSWRDVFVDLVQGQVQHLLLSLLAGMRANASCISQVCSTVTATVANDCVRRLQGHEQAW